MLVLTLAFCSCLGIVHLFKGINVIFIPKIILPVGISFYIFQEVSCLIDVYSGKIKAQKNLSSFALYLSLYPQLIAGPIVRYSDIEKQIIYRENNINYIACRGNKKFYTWIYIEGCYC